MKLLYSYVSMVASRLKKAGPAAGSPYTDLARDIKADIDIYHATADSDKEFLDYVEGRLSGHDQMLALKEFKRNYYSWRRRHEQK